VIYNIGRRTGMADAGGSEAWSYDQMGRALAAQRITNSITKSFNYTYNYDGSIATLAYPSGRMVTYTVDNAGRPSTAMDVANSINYVTGGCGVSSGGACYAPQGALSIAILGYSGTFAGMTLTDTYSNRLQPNEMKAANPTSTLMDLVYTFNIGSGNTGNVLKVINNLNANRDQFFAYDQVNRLYVGQTNNKTGSDCFGSTYTYDAWGNLSATPAISGYTCAQPNLNVTINSNNQISPTGFSYDASGNTLGDGTNSYAWNGAGQMKTAAGVTYSYDGEGNRVMKTGTKIYWYGLSSTPLAESDTSGNFTDEYILFAGTRVAHRVVSGNSIYYYVQDHLGTSRMMITSTGTACYDADFTPFGGEMVISNTCPQNYKFTGKERDTESGLDNFGARYDASSLGRFMTPDPMGGHLENPQSLNKYAYVLNNPTSLTDPTGLDSYLSCTQTKDNASTCQSQTVGYDANGKAQTATVQGVTNADKSFTATQIGNDANGNLVDKTTGTGSYTASANGSGVQFSNNGGQTSSSGVFVNGTPQNTFQDAGFANGGALSGFTFTLTNSKLEAGQTEAGSFTFAGTPDQAGAALQKAGSNPRSGENVGMNEYRSPGSFWTGANSSHFNVFQIGLKPWLSVPQAQGDMHFGEHNPYSPFGWVPHSSEANQ
jgi:RHS repeat-associated protein